MVTPRPFKCILVFVHSHLLPAAYAILLTTAASPRFQVEPRDERDPDAVIPGAKDGQHDELPPQGQKDPHLLLDRLNLSGIAMWLSYFSVTGWEAIISIAKDDAVNYNPSQKRLSAHSIRTPRNKTET